MRILGCILGTTLLLGAAAGAADADDAPPTFTLRIQPCKPTAASEKLRLTPEVDELQAGNAAEDLRKAIDRIGTPAFGSEQAKFQLLANEWSRRTREDLVDALQAGGPGVDAVRSGMERFAEPLFADLHLAARRRDCDWRPPADPEELLLRPFFGPKGDHLGRIYPLLQLDAEMRLARGDFDGARRSMQTVLALARWTAKANRLDACLTAAVMDLAVSDAVEHWVQTPGSPNMHETLAAVPETWIDLAPTLAVECRPGRLLEAVFSPRRPPPMGDPAWRPAFRRFAATDVPWTDGPPDEQQTAAAVKAVDDFLALYGLPGGAFAQIVRTFTLGVAARRGLASRGRPEAELDRMSVEETVLRWSSAVYDDQARRWSKWIHLPYPKSAARQEAYLDRLRSEPGPAGTFPFARARLRDLVFVRWVERRAAQRRAMLRLVELVRWSAAERGVWPKSLDELPLPAPIDPVSGEQFPFARDGATITIAAPKPAFLQADYGPRYLLELSDLPAAAAPPKP